MTILFELALTFYFISTLLGVVDLCRGNKATSKWMIGFAVPGFVLHTSSLIVRFYDSGYMPLISPHETASFFSWSIVLLFCTVEYKYRTGLLGSFIMPVVLILMLSSSLLPRDIIPLLPVFQSYWLGIHTVLAFTGGAVFALACGVGIIYLIQEHFLKSRRLGELFHKLPNLQILDEVNFRLVTMGFPLFTLAILAGVLWAQSAGGSYLRGSPKEVFSLATWLIFAIVLYMRIIAGWRGKKAAVLSTAGFIGVLFAFIGLIFY